MAAVINQQAGPSSISDAPHIELVQKVDTQIARIISICVVTKEEGFLTISEDKCLRVLLKRDSGQFWPTVVEYLPTVPTCIFFHEESLTVYVGFVTGAVIMFSLTPDMNTLETVRRWKGHASNVSGIVYSSMVKQIFSCSRDKTLIWHCSDTGLKVGSHVIASPCTVIQFDAPSNFVFIGDYSGSVFVLRIVGSSAQVVSKLSAHTGSISDLVWDASRKLLFSASSDMLVIMWDIGGKQGQIYELNGHNSKLTSLVLSEDNSRLLSSDESGHLVCWDLNTKRVMAPPWADSDRCALCDVPFFWNVKVMWDRKIVGVRRHHCRTCGKSVCSNCCNHFTIFPAMGFEKPARICRVCHQKMEQHPDKFDLTPLACMNELRTSINEAKLHRDKNKLVTVGTDRAIMVWDVTSMLDYRS